MQHKTEVREYGLTLYRWDCECGQQSEPFISEKLAKRSALKHSTEWRVLAALETYNAIQARCERLKVGLV